MKSDILEIVNNIPEEQRFHHVSIHPKNISSSSTTPKTEEKKPEKKENKFIEDTNSYKDIAVTNIRRVFFNPFCLFVFFFFLGRGR